MSDTVRSWLVCMLPRCFCVWLWAQEYMPLGSWAPHILGRVLGSDAKRVK
jgi:hypothetical protein